jgi:cob(I)alamin adenosyltransferase
VSPASESHDPASGDTPTDQPPTEIEERKLRSAKSLVLVNTGNGKGKSTAAFGTMLRSIARGWNVAVIQFLKSGDWKVGEEAIGRQLGVDWWAIGDGFTWLSEDMDQTEAIAREAWQHAAATITAGEHRLVILDEITYPMNWGWISTDEVVSVIQGRPEKVSVVCTGRNAPQALIDIADTVTEMTQVKHAFTSGIAAKKGIDY